MASRQSPKSRRPDFVFSTPEHGDIAIEFKWKQLNGRYEVGSITITPTDPAVPFEPVILRRIPWVDLINAQRKEQLAPTRRATQSKPRAVGPDSTRTLTDDDLKYVAALYLEAWQSGIPVQRHIADTLNIALPTATRRIGMARSRGYISSEINPPTQKKAKDK
jgi:hypothetical protein